MGIHNPYAKRREGKGLPKTTEAERFMWERRRYGRVEAERRASERAASNSTGDPA